MSVLRTAGIVLRKDLRIELRSRELVTTTGLFALLVALLASLAFYLDANRARALAPGVVWIAITFAGLLAMSRSWAREKEGDAFRMLLLSPAPRAGIFFGKSLSSFFFLLSIELILVPFVGMLFHVDLWPILAPLCVILLLGTLGFVVTGTLFSALSVKSSARDLMLSIVIFPLVTPALLSAVVATRELFGGADMRELLDWLRLLGAYDLTMATLGAWLFGALIGD